MTAILEPETIDVNAPVPEGTGLLHELMEKGDTTVRWSRDNTVEVEAARTMFNTLKGKGYTAFRVDSVGNRGGRMDAFDEKAERIIMAPQYQGG